MNITNQTGMIEIPAKIRRGLNTVALQVEAMQNLAKATGTTITGEHYAGIVKTFESEFKGLTVKITDSAVELHTGIVDSRIPQARFVDFTFHECKPKKRVGEDGKTHSTPSLELDLDLASPVRIFVHSEAGKPQSQIYDLQSVGKALMDAGKAIMEAYTPELPDTE